MTSELYRRSFDVAAQMKVKMSVVSCGDKHSLACDEYGVCYSWGSARYGKLGQGAFLSLPTTVLQYSSAASFVVIALYCKVSGVSIHPRSWLMSLSMHGRAIRRSTVGAK